MFNLVVKGKEYKRSFEIREREEALQMFRDIVANLITVRTITKTGPRLQIMLLQNGELLFCA